MTCVFSGLPSYFCARNTFKVSKFKVKFRMLKCITLMCLNFGICNIINFLFGTNEKLIILGVPIFMYIILICIYFLIAFVIIFVMSQLHSDFVKCI